jgi:cytochrome c-type biogenesis protein CcmE
MTARSRRMAWVGALTVGVALSVLLAVFAFRSNMMYFFTPTDIAKGGVPEQASFRLGGLVETGSVQRDGESLRVDFVLADCDHRVPVSYVGILPDLFREGQGIVTTGRMQGDVFKASQVLAKHDENYMPPELIAALKTDTGHSCEPFRPVTARSPS